MTNQATRAQLQKIIAGLSEGVLLVEPDQTIAYANIAALRMHDVSDLDALGATVADYRRNYIALEGADHSKVGSHPIDRVVEGKAMDDAIVRVARRSASDINWVHRIRSLVMTDAKGEPDFVVVVITDITDEAEAQERFERTFSANPAPSLICRLGDFRFIKVNEGFLQLTGLKMEEILGRTVYEVDVLRQAKQRDLAVERLRAGRTIPQMEACLAVPADHEKFVIVAGQPIEMGDEACMLFTFADLEPRRRAEKALRQSEERFVKCFRLAPIPMTIATAREHRLVDVNEAFCATTGYMTQDAVGRTANELGLWIDPAARSRFERELAKSGHVQAAEARLKIKSGAEIEALISAEVAQIGEEASILCAFQDITDRKRSEAELVTAIEAVMADASWFAQAVVEKLAGLRKPQGAKRNGAAAGLAELTGREREVLGLICQGLGNNEIGQRLGVSSNTARNHVASLYRKLGVNRRSALIVWARERGFGDGVLPPKPRRKNSS